MLTNESSSIDFDRFSYTDGYTTSDFCSRGKIFHPRFPLPSSNVLSSIDVQLDGRTSNRFFFFKNALIKKEFDTHVDMIISIQNANNREYNASYFLRKEQNKKNKRKLMCKQRGRIQLIWWEENYKQTDSVRWICCAAFCVSV